MSQTILGHIPTVFVDRILFLDVHWRNEDVWAKEVRYQELRACRRSSTLDCVKYIMNMKYAKCNMQREGPAGRAGFESMSY